MTRRVVASAFVLWILAACSESQVSDDTATSNAQARAILDSVRYAAGGADGLANVRTLAVQYVHTRFQILNRGNDGSVPRSIDVVQVRDFENGRQFYERRAAGPDGDWERIVIVPGAAFRIDRHTNQTTVFRPDAASSALYSGLEFRWYAYSILDEARYSASSLSLHPDTTSGANTYQVVSFHGRGTETNTLWIDADTKRIVRRRLETSDPITGRASTTLEYSDYADVSGIPMPMTVDVFVNDTLFERFELLELHVNAEVQDSAFEPPDG